MACPGSKTLICGQLRPADVNQAWTFGTVPGARRQSGDRAPNGDDGRILRCKTRWTPSSFCYATTD
jgi:hypothetical protein